MNIRSIVGIGKRIFIIGNGGSCAIAEHISTDLNKRCKVKATTLSNNSLLTALTNDYGQEQCVCRMDEDEPFWTRRIFLWPFPLRVKVKIFYTLLDHASDCLALTFSIFGMKGLDPFPTHSYGT